MFFVVALHEGGSTNTAELASNILALTTRLAKIFSTRLGALVDVVTNTTGIPSEALRTQALVVAHQILAEERAPGPTVEQRIAFVDVLAVDPVVGDLETARTRTHVRTVRVSASERTLARTSLAFVDINACRRFDARFVSLLAFTREGSDSVHALRTSSTASVVHLATFVDIDTFLLGVLLESFVADAHVTSIRVLAHTVRAFAQVVFTFIDIGDSVESDTFRTNVIPLVGALVGAEFAL